MSARGAAAFLTLLLLASGCEQERPTVVRGGPDAGTGAPLVMTTELQAGPPAPGARIVNPYADDERALADGERLYGWFNCAGCHGANGGGGMGPPFADGSWIYGSDPENIFASIVRGRPNGMPAFGGRIPDDQVWKLAAYVKTFDPEEGEETAQRTSAAGR